MIGMSLYEKILTEDYGDSLFLLGNEAIARGVLEAGVAHATTYPGTPSSEVGDVLYSIAKGAGIKFEFAVNEKVALESAFASAQLGHRSFVFMKHVGLNVASDPMMSIAYTGINGPLVIMTADDPSLFSSQNEQDNRNYAKTAHLPIVEPSNSQEAKDFLVYAFDLSAKFRIPVLFRTTTRVSHTRNRVILGKIPDRVQESIVETDFVALPSHSIVLKRKLQEKLFAIEKSNLQSRFTRLEGDPDSNIGVITSGEAYNVVRDTLDKRGLNSEVLKLGISYPLPKQIISQFLTRHDIVVIVEEVDPFIEESVRSIAQMGSISCIIHGKMDSYIQMDFEVSPDLLDNSFARLFGYHIIEETVFPPEDTVPIRPPALCPGCPHRSSFYALKRALTLSKITDPIFSSDIGCYSLGYYEPFNVADTMLDMGSSIGVGSGYISVSDRKAIAFIGDSTFFHSGIPALINAVSNHSNLLVIILDNSVTAMTGRQPNPGTPSKYSNEEKVVFSIEGIVRSLGVDYMEIIDPYDLKGSVSALLKGLKVNGVSVIISRRECAILRDQRLKREGAIQKYRVEASKCTSCFNCIEKFSCPALYEKEGKVAIDTDICDGCGVCSQPYVCPFKAIEVVIDEE